MLRRHVVTGLLFLAACRGKPAGPAESLPSVETPVPAHPVTNQTPAGTPETSPPALERVASQCPDEKEIRDGGDSTPEGVLFEAYRLALGNDTEEARQAFLRLFVQGAPKDHILGSIWPRVREHVGKYVTDPARPSYTVCRRVPLAEDRIKIFVRCRDPRKSDPPSVLVIEQGRWRLDVMTP